MATDSVPHKPDGGRDLNVGALVGVGAVVIAIGAFVVQNTHETQVDWLFFDFEWSVWWLVVVTILLTLLGERLVAYVMRRRRRGRAASD